jgi:hypothetical protein
MHIAIFFFFTKVHMRLEHTELLTTGSIEVASVLVVVSSNKNPLAASLKIKLLTTVLS